MTITRTCYKSLVLSFGGSYMNIRFLTFATLAFVSCMFLSTQAHKNHTIIPDASYCVYDRTDEILGSFPAQSEYVTFYTCDGTCIERFDDRESLRYAARMLDKNTPKPQPVRYKIKYWPGIEIGFGAIKGKPGWFIVFYDRNGKRINSYRYDKEKQEIACIFDCSDERTIMTKWETFVFDEKNPQVINSRFPLDLSNIQTKN